MKHIMIKKPMQWISTICVAFSLMFYAVAHAASEKEGGFASPEEAVKTLMTAVKEDNTDKILQILGEEAKPLLHSGDSVEDKNDRKRFLKAYEETYELKKINDAQYTLIIGNTGWPFPIPLIKEANRWYFDTKAGLEEILKRRVGRNELFTIQSMLAYVDAQKEYYIKNPEHDKFLSYAQKILSTPNKRDGLYYPVQENEHPSPLGEQFAKAQESGYGENKSSTAQAAYHGYYYRILKSQGPDASGGAFDYVVKGKMLGHALIAWPAQYANSGVMTFIVSHDGKVYEKDLGKDTATVVSSILKFNPDKTWTLIKEQGKTFQP